MSTIGKKLIPSSNLFPVVGIGASAGGLAAFKKLLGSISEDSGMAYVLVQHLDPTHESILPELLQKVTKVPISEISDDVKVLPNHIYILPSNKMLVANDGVLELSPRNAKKNERNLPIDLFFTSLAEIHQSHAIGIVLSGTGSDGTNGLKAIKEHGGITFAQDEVSAGSYGMPRSAVLAGFVDFILPPDQMPPKLIEITTRINKSDEDLENLSQSSTEIFLQINDLLRTRTGTDFTYYKQTTIHRRILRRMAINKIEELSGYLPILKENTTEQDLLYKDLLIPVTSFFRDPVSFQNFCETVFPPIIKSKRPDEPIRAWVAGCSTGQEAYSVAICLKEYLEAMGMSAGAKKVQIFATDLSEASIEKARKGIYALNELEGLSSERLQKFFIKTNGHYQLHAEIREMCVFAIHNFIKHPPFGKMDFISCRNVLIYMEAYLQKKVLTTFHYALNPNGYLWLGKSETISGVPELFISAIGHDKIFIRKEGQGRFMHIASLRSEQDLRNLHSNVKVGHGRKDFQKVADEIMLTKYTPPGVVVNESMEIVHFRGLTADYLEQSPGKPSHHLLKMAKEGLGFELRNLLHKLKSENTPVIKENIPLKVHGIERLISIEALRLPDTLDLHYLILFHDAHLAGLHHEGVKPVRSKTSSKAKNDSRDARIQDLERELAQMRVDMRNITEDQEGVNAELQSANEELLSGSEELQSLNEELETSKEELQSTNEELTVLNQEMVTLNEQLTESCDYSEAIISNIRTPLLVLNRQLRIQTANKAFYTTFRVNEMETEGRLIYDIGNRDWNSSILRDLLEKILPEQTSISDFELNHTFPFIGNRTMLINAHEITRDASIEKSILLAIEDISERKLAEEVIHKSAEQFRLMADLMPQKVWTASKTGHINFYNKNWPKYTGMTPDELMETGWKTVIHPDDWEETIRKWELSLGSGINFEMIHRFRNADGEYKWHLSRSTYFTGINGQLDLWTGTSTEVHEQKEQREKLEIAVEQRTNELQLSSETLQQKNEDLDKMNLELKSFTYISSHDLQEPLRKIQTFVTRILETEKQILSEKGKDYFQRIQNSANRMQTLIEDLLAFSRLSSIDREFQMVHLWDVIEEVKTDLHALISDKKASVEVGELCDVNIIPFQFRKLIDNLVRNALKFSSPDRNPHINIKSVIALGSALKVERLNPEKLYCHINFSDNGIGFLPQYNQRIFDLFERLHDRNDYPGTGIGLSIVKKIVENHHGYITASGELGKGATFDIYLPSH